VQHIVIVGLLPRHGVAEDVRWLGIDPCSVFHTLNAYDDGDHVAIDLVRYPKMLVEGRLADSPPPVLDRWVIPDLA
jgi:carotenoid cleavage dioxygenase-like enzyme